jgi:hypothetical protein
MSKRRVGLRKCFQLAISAAALALSACSKSESPVVNPNPVKLLRVHGTADSSMSIRIGTQYFSSNPQCRRRRHPFNVASYLEGIGPSPVFVWAESEVARSGDSYEATVAIDHFQEGKCGWYPFVVAFQITNRDGLTYGQVPSGKQATEVVSPSGSMIWINTLGRGDPRVVSPHTTGSSFFPPKQVECRASHSSSGAFDPLMCIPTKSLGKSSTISEEVKEAKLDFIDLTESPTTTP